MAGHIVQRAHSATPCVVRPENGDGSDRCSFKRRRASCRSFRVRVQPDAIPAPVRRRAARAGSQSNRAAAPVSARRRWGSAGALVVPVAALPPFPTRATLPSSRRLDTDSNRRTEGTTHRTVQHNQRVKPAIGGRGVLDHRSAVPTRLMGGNCAGCRSRSRCTGAKSQTGAAVSGVDPTGVHSRRGRPIVSSSRKTTGAAIATPAGPSASSASVCETWDARDRAQFHRPPRHCVRVDEIWTWIISRRASGNARGALVALRATS